MNVETKVHLNPMKLLGQPHSRVWLINWLEMLLSAKGYQLKATDLMALKRRAKSPVHATPGYVAAAFARTLPADPGSQR